MKKLELEFRNEFKPAASTFQVGNTQVMITPPISEDYWVFRIKLYKDQALIAFPKFTTLGIGFAIEDDWNTNLPYRTDAIGIYNHIKHNKLYKQISKQMCIDAITILQKACIYYKTHEMPQNITVGDFKDMVNSFYNLRKMMKHS